MTPLTKLLLAKYDPTNPQLQEPLQAPTVATKSEASPVQGPTPRSASEAIHASTGVILIMSSANFSESVIFKELREFNLANPSLMGRSFTLPVAMYGLPAGSWVYLPQKEDE